MKETLYKYQGAGNDFIIIDNRNGHIKDEDLAAGGGMDVVRLCNRHYGIGSDGLMLLECSAVEGCCFRMRFFNPDGSEGMMCGNGGRCIVAFAAYCGIKPLECDGYRNCKYIFEAPDGIHEAFIVNNGVENYGRASVVNFKMDSDVDSVHNCVAAVPARLWIRLKMKDVEECRRISIQHGTNNGTPPETLCKESKDTATEGLFLNTGARHFVTFAENVENCDVVTKGRLLRYDKAFAPEGANINFLEPQHNEHPTSDSAQTQPAISTVSSNCPSVKVRTYEKGVEDETEACGTGITASAIASYISGISPLSVDEHGICHYAVKARRETLEVEFKPKFHKDDNGNAQFVNGVLSPVASSVWLSGPAVRVAEIIY